MEAQRAAPGVGAAAGTGGGRESDGIVVWHTDRLFRQPGDLELLIELDDRGFLVASAHGSRNLADPDE
ncbi:MAG TPA: hypothetical protein VGG05_18230 [Pseudonocardiaceae bacterium]